MVLPYLKGFDIIKCGFAYCSDISIVVLLYSDIVGKCKVDREVVKGPRGPIVMIVETIQCKVD
jgi:hypothetical protein